MSHCMSSAHIVPVSHCFSHDAQMSVALAKVKDFDLCVNGEDQKCVIEALHICIIVSSFYLLPSIGYWGISCNLVLKRHRGLLFVVRQ